MNVSDIKHGLFQMTTSEEISKYTIALNKAELDEKVVLTNSDADEIDSFIRDNREALHGALH